MAISANTTLNGLSNVTISSVTDNEVLAYDSVSGEWINQTFSEINPDHGVLLGLGDDDHTQYLLASGTRQLTGNWNTGVFDVTFGDDLFTSTKGITLPGTTQYAINVLGDLTSGLYFHASEFQLHNTGTSLFRLVRSGVTIGDFQIGDGTREVQYDASLEQLKLTNSGLATNITVLDNVDFSLLFPTGGKGIRVRTGDAAFTSHSDTDAKVAFLGSPARYAFTDTAGAEIMALNAVTGALTVPKGIGAGSAGATSATELVDIDHVWTTTAGSDYNISSLMQAEPAGASTAQYRSVLGWTRLDTAQSLSGGVVGVFGQATVLDNIAATMTGTAGSNGLIGGYFSCNATDATVSYAAGVFFDMPNVADGIITTGYGLRIGGAAVTGTGSITNLYGIFIPDVSLGTSKNFDIYLSGTNPDIAISNNNTLSFVDFGGNTLMSIQDVGTSGDVVITGAATLNSVGGNTSIKGNLTIGRATAGIDYTITVDGETNDGVITWMEDEDYFKFSDDIFINDAENIVLGTTTGTKIGTGTTQKLSFYGVNPVIQPLAYTQTYSTADKTHADFTSLDIGAFTGGVIGFLDAAERDNIRTQFNALKADVADLKQLVNSLIDDLQTLGLVG